MNSRKPTSSDRSDIKLILEDTDLFPPEMLEDMIEPFLHGNEHQDRWLVCETETDGVIGFSYFFGTGWLEVTVLPLVTKVMVFYEEIAISIAMS